MAYAGSWTRADLVNSIVEGFYRTESWLCGDENTKFKKLLFDR